MIRLELPGGIDISAYRIVQEGLTNALKHAHATEAEVALRYASAQLGIEVSDNGHGGPRKATAVVTGSSESTSASGSTTAR